MICDMQSEATDSKKITPRRATLTCPSSGALTPWPFWYRGTVDIKVGELKGRNIGGSVTYLLCAILALLPKFAVGFGWCFH